MRREVMGYDEFGASLYPSFRNQPFTFTGYQLDGISDTLYAQAREYLPNVGRFISQDTHWYPSNMIYGDNQIYSVEPTPLRGIVPDPLAIGQSSNSYAYTLNNPLIYLDLNGEFILTAAAIVTLKVVGVSALVGGTVSAGANIVSQGLQNDWNNIRWGEVGINFVGGAASGALAGTGWGMPVVIAGNATINAGKYAWVQHTYNEPVRLDKLIYEAGIGAVSGWIGGNSRSLIRDLQGYYTIDFFGTTFQQITSSVSRSTFNERLLRESLKSVWEGSISEFIEHFLGEGFDGISTFWEGADACEPEN